MRKIVSVILVCMMTLSAFTLASCTAIKKVDGDLQTTVQTTTATTEQKEPVPVDSVNGKGARQLLESFFDDYKNSKSFDLSMSMTTTEEGVTTTESVEIKLNDKEMYMAMTMDETDMKIWFVGGVMYVDMAGEKYKTSTSDVNDMFGEGFVDELLSTIPTEFPEVYMKKVGDAQIYSYKGVYYFTVTVSAEEAEQMEVGDEEYTETIYFNSIGEVVKIVDKSATYTMTLNINSYGKNIVIAPPVDANGFEDITDMGGGQGSSEYAVYEWICETLENATTYSMDVSVDGQNMSYATDGNGKYLCVFEDTSYQEMWMVGGNGYVAQNGERPIKTSLTKDFKSSFEALEMLKDSVAMPIYESDMKDIEYIEDYYGASRLSFELEYFDGTSDCYHIEFYTGGNNITIVNIFISVVEENEVVSEIIYHFSEINDNSLKIYAPI